MTFMTRLAVGCSFAVLLYGHVMAQGIYTCVDAKGRKITSDRPIAECMDRAQKEITPAGTVKRVLTPPPTAQERAVLDEKEKQDLEERTKADVEKRHTRILLKRYPDRAAHDKDRVAALESTNEVIKTATKRSEDLVGQRKGITTELEFYKDSPGKAPPALKRRLDEIDGNLAVQTRLLADKEAEKKRVTERFDAQTARLKPHWEVAAASSPATATTSLKKP